MKKVLDERIDEGVLRWFGHVESMRAKRICVGECSGGHSVGRPRKRWNDTVEFRLWPSLQLKGHKGEIFFPFLSFSSTDLLLSLISWHDVCRPRDCGKWFMYKKRIVLNIFRIHIIA